ncbi:MAG: hypothetical protein IPK83_09850 [Planctomycetes bacterium]|nr:hypothetical protein [Planctomycetota bacterium]
MRTRKRAVWPTVLSCLIVASASALLVGASFLQLTLPANTTINDFGAAAAAHGWPAKTPADQPAWPAVTQWSEWSRFGYVERMAWSAHNQQTTHQMQVDRWGWPFTVFEQRQCWWPWSDPAWKSAERPDSRIYVRWDGVALNGLVLGVPLAILLMAPNFIRARSRRKEGLCLKCGYDLRGPTPDNPLARCPECGTMHETPAVP